MEVLPKLQFVFGSVSEGFFVLCFDATSIVQSLENNKRLEVLFGLT